MYPHVGASVTDSGSGVRIHVGVGQRCRADDVESPALQAKSRARNIPSGRWKKRLGRFKMQALTRCDAEVVSTRTQQSVSSRVSSVGRWNVTHGFDSRESSRPATDTRGDGQHTSGAMERYTWVRFAGKLTHCHKTHIAKVSIPLGQSRTCQGGSKCKHAQTAGAKITSKRTAVGQFKGSFSEALESNARIRLGKRTHPALPRHAANR